MHDAWDETEPTRRDFDYVIVGGGLQAALMVLALRASRAHSTIAVIEREKRLGGNHTWSFHAHDLSASASSWIEPLVVQRWSGYEVRFSDFTRQLENPYAAILSERVHEVISDALAAPEHLLRCDCEVVRVDPDRVVLASGEELRGRLVVDARGSLNSAPSGGRGFQKFVGQEWEFGHPHGLERPVLMDACVDQSDGYRFFYLLPFGPTRLLIEDTRFTNAAELDPESYRQSIESYREDAGWGPGRIVREETGVLPMPWTQDIQPPDDGVLRAGYRGGWFHPATGYSLPVAARLADAVASEEPEAVRDGALEPLGREHRSQVRYCHLLNNLAFLWYPARVRWHIFSRFYRFPLPPIRRFYALQLTTTDRIRLLAGRPPRGLSIRYRLEAGTRA